MHLNICKEKKTYKIIFFCRINIKLNKNNYSKSSINAINTSKYLDSDGLFKEITLERLIRNIWFRVKVYVLLVQIFSIFGHMEGTLDYGFVTVH